MCITQRELEQLYYLNREIEDDKRRLQELCSEATRTGRRITGLPHNACIADKTALAAQIADLRAEVERKALRCIEEYARLHRFVEGIEDAYMRQVVVLRHINGFGWRQVAMHIGGGNTEESVRQAYRRWLKKQGGGQRAA